MSDTSPPPPTDSAQRLTHIAALEAELALYAFKYGLTNEARRLLAVRLHGVGGLTSDS